MSENYWKDRYKDTWEKAAKRETAIKDYIQKKTGFVVEGIGLGTGSTEFLSGSAASRGFAKGGSDFKIRGTNIEIEVTGDLTGRVSKQQPLWIRPDKIRAAMKNGEAEKWIIHHLARDNTVRSILLDMIFFNRFSKGAFKTIHPRIRGTVETYIEVPASDRSVLPFREFMNRLRAERAQLNAESEDSNT